jgi:hypothetical protein
MEATHAKPMLPLADQQAIELCTSRCSRCVDAALFEHSFEASWKPAQSVLGDRFGIQANAPKPVIRACFENGLLTEQQTRPALAMVDHCSLTSHTYNEALADGIFAALPGYGALMHTWLDALARN